MPFGLVFAALVFGLFWTWLGIGFLAAPQTPAKLAGVFLILLGVALALGLSMRRQWARWAGFGCAAALAGFGVWSILQRAGAVDFLLLFASVATALLLLNPSTGDVRHGATGPLPKGGAGRVLGATAALSSLGLVGVTAWMYQARAPVSDAAVVVPASIAAESVRWQDFGSGQESAQAEGKPMLVTFVASWCGFCKKMDRTTWRNPSVVERLNSQVVPVRVDTDDSREQRGFRGTRLAAEYQVSGTPTQLILAGDGSVVARASGFQTAGQLLSWIDEALGSDSSPRQVRVAGP